MWEKKKSHRNFNRDINFRNGFHRYQSLNNVTFNDKQVCVFSLVFLISKLYIITKLYYLRDKLARIEDEGVPLIIGKEVLFGAVDKDIYTKDALFALAKKVKQFTPFLEKYADQIIETIKYAKEDVKYHFLALFSFFQGCSRS